MRIDVEGLFAGCCARHGVEPFDPGADDLEGLSILADDVCSLASNQLDVLRALDWITNQITIGVLIRKRLLAQPALRDIPLPAPVFIIAPGRTGSTLLQWLLALEPTFRSPHLWELWRPMHGDDPESRRLTILACKEALKQVSPSARELHPMVAEAPEECHWIMRHNVVRAGLLAAPGYGDWLQYLDVTLLRSFLEDYRQVVQVMQASDPSRTWLSKCFAHMHNWPVLFDVFPDARVIRIHRDPRAVVASCCSLFQHLARGVAPLGMGRSFAASLCDGQHRMMAADRTAPGGQVIDIMYEDLRASPATVAGRVAQWLRIADVEAFSGRVDRYMADAKSIRAAPHNPHLDEFGVSERALLDQFEPYIGWVRDRLDPAFCR